jgi:alkylation response protein AidB-like acyl-CoA dehydrogenase
MDFNLTEEQRMWRDSVRSFCERVVKPRARHVDETGEFKWEAVSLMGPLGLLGLNVAEEYGGAGVDAVSAAIAIEELGRACGSTALSIAAHNGLGCGSLALFRTPARREMAAALGQAARDIWPRCPHRTRRRFGSCRRRQDRARLEAASGSSRARRCGSPMPAWRR